MGAGDGANQKYATLYALRLKRPEKKMKDEKLREDGGSWLPTLILAIAVFAIRLCYGQGQLPVLFRRWYNLQRIQLKRRFGLRDNNKYKMGAGDGANQKYKRQG
eukprot:CAMPEP_0171323614 /NCGR_PEP_ID=MMETSP0816-20121228/115682_1 /TAXON_ID=420281 /ORGANISM="Proboscia inermis, Strain CCAP1064/1" /LENGTH=103 /DNA_ID=CAMNT_0011822363 /DNA_START=407 /DNA_END=718 /DNA_ORIENTATION=+